MRHGPLFTMEDGTGQRNGSVHVAFTRRRAEPEREQRPPDVASLRAQFATRERNAQEAPGVSGKGKTRLLAALRMERLVAEERQRHGENTPACSTESHAG